MTKTKRTAIIVSKQPMLKAAIINYRQNGWRITSVSTFIFDLESRHTIHQYRVAFHFWNGRDNDFWDIFTKPSYLDLITWNKESPHRTITNFAKKKKRWMKGIEVKIRRLKRPQIKNLRTFPSTVEPRHRRQTTRNQRNQSTPTLRRRFMNTAPTSKTKQNSEVIFKRKW